MATPSISHCDTLGCRDPHVEKHCFTGREGTPQEDIYAFIGMLFYLQKGQGPNTSLEFMPRQTLLCIDNSNTTALKTGDGKHQYSRTKKSKTCEILQPTLVPRGELLPLPLTEAQSQQGAVGTLWNY